MALKKKAAQQAAPTTPPPPPANVKAGVELVVNQLYAQSGGKGVTASELVDAARDPASPAHAGFTWDPRVAHQQYLLYEARKWLREVTIVRLERKERLVNVQATRTSVSTEGVYKPISVVVNNKPEFVVAFTAILGQVERLIDALSELEKEATVQKTRNTLAMVRQRIIAARNQMDTLK